MASKNLHKSLSVRWEPLQEASKTDFNGIMACEEEPLASTDFKGNPHSSIVDMEFTEVMQGNLSKVVAWYDNE